MAPSWLRFGNFEIFHSRKDKANVKKLADYVLKEVVKIDQKGLDNKGNRYENLLRQVAKSTAEMVAGWQSVGKTKLDIGWHKIVMNATNMPNSQLGFNHGVMNTGEILFFFY